MNKNSFLDYYKTILEKVSFDGQLLSKEYKKAKQMLGASDARELDVWLKSKGFSLNMENLSQKQTRSWQVTRNPKLDRV
ncbi:hypothetical protein [uncultured Algoriphagus sp.]|uniref:hypothetical protein n=1 Tax=uncultured Algoriphagus sp. TaxID=417365 RepID=UPI0030EE7AEA|tara:strand:- start:455 stop:691 length:237 start_codon:yes stop_codon:yes gene_type:complete